MRLRPSAVFAVITTLALACGGSHSDDPIAPEGSGDGSTTATTPHGKTELSDEVDAGTTVDNGAFDYETDPPIGDDDDDDAGTDAGDAGAASDGGGTGQQAGAPRIQVQTRLPFAMKSQDRRYLTVYVRHTTRLDTKVTVSEGTDLGLLRYISREPYGKVQARIRMRYTAPALSDGSTVSFRFTARSPQGIETVLPLDFAIQAD